jgi:hypothetical protein
VSRRVPGQEQDGKADQPVPQAQRDPGQRDREQGQQHEIDRVQAVVAEIAGHRQGHDRHRDPNQRRQKRAPAPETRCRAGVTAA